MAPDDARNDWNVETHWNVETLRQYVVTSLNDFKIRGDEVRRESDLRYQQRFEASERALETSYATTREAQNVALAAVERSLNAALAAAEKAIDKAELAQRALNIGLSDRLDASIQALTEKVNKNANELTKSDGHTTGVSSTVATMISVAAVVVALLSMVLGFINGESASNSQHYGPNSHMDSRTQQ